jgi:hypothetical protein
MNLLFYVWLASLALLVGILCIYSSSGLLIFVLLCGNDVLAGDILHVCTGSRLYS